METSTIVYDLDTSGGLMEQIQTLLASPKSEDGGKRSRKTQKEQRRGGRSTNHDTCDSCREGGDLLCCDHCPAAFHLQCCNPPLNEDMLPSADWMCHRCVARRKKRELRRERLNGLLDQPSVKQSSPEVELGAVRLEGAAGAGPPAAVAQVRLVERPATPASSTSTDTATPTPSEQNDADDDDLLDVEDEAQGLGSSSGSDGTGGEYLRKPFALLIAAAMEMNPTQFQLPSDLTCTAALPGTGKRRRKELPVLKSMKRRQQHDLDPNAPVPLPVKLCFSCGRSCRLAPLIQCDFCPLLFHMECTEPSLLAMPMGTWMCPKHRERLALSQGNVGLGSRCQLFDQFRDQVSQHAIKLDFLQLMRCPDWPSTKESDPPTRKALKVPKAVKLQYQCPQTLAAPEGIRIGELIRNGVPEQRYSSPFSSPCSTSSFTPHFTTSQAEQREWLEDIIALQCSIVRRFSAKQRPPVLWQCEQAGKADVKTCVTSQEGSSPCPSGRPVLLASHSRDPQVEVTGRLCPHCGTVGSSLQPASCGCGSAVTSMASATHLRNHTGGAVATEAKQEDTVTINPCTGHTPTLTTRSQLGQLVRSQPRIPETCGVSSPPAGTRALTPPRCPQGNGLTDEKASLGAITPSTESSVPGVSPPSKGPLCSDLERAAVSHVDIELTQLDERFIKLLAWQRIQQLFQPKTTTGRPRQGPPAQEASSKGQVRAAFYPLTGKGGAVNMCYRTLYIGTGADMDVCLAKYGHCNYVSGKHACIFYDENTKHYELLNYSEHGTTVDNVLYSCDFSEKTSHRPSGCATNRAQSLIGHCRKRKQEERGEEEDEDEEQGPAGGVMSSRAGGSAAVRCACRASSSSLIGGSGAGWEGTALLHHGSCIKLGCLQFVFSVADFTHGLPKQEEPQEEARTEPQERGEEARTEPDVRQPLVLLQPPVLCSSMVP